MLSYKNKFIRTTALTTTKCLTWSVVKPIYLANSVTGVMPITYLLTYLLIANCSKQNDQLKTTLLEVEKVQNIYAELQK